MPQSSKYEGVPPEIDRLTEPLFAPEHNTLLIVDEIISSSGWLIIIESAILHPFESVIE